MASAYFATIVCATSSGVAFDFGSNKMDIGAMRTVSWQGLQAYLGRTCCTTESDAGINFNCSVISSPMRNKAVPQSHTLSSSLIMNVIQSCACPFFILFTARTAAILLITQICFFPGNALYLLICSQGNS